MNSFWQKEVGCGMYGTTEKTSQKDRSGRTSIFCQTSGYHTKCMVSTVADPHKLGQAREKYVPVHPV